VTGDLLESKGEKRFMIEHKGYRVQVAIVVKHAWASSSSFDLQTKLIAFRRGARRLSALLPRAH